MGASKIDSPQQLRDAYRRVQDRIAQAAVRYGRNREGIVLVAVTKTATPDQIRTLVELGHRDFGENRVQQLIQRVAQLEEFLSRKRLLGGEGRVAEIGGRHPKSSTGSSSASQGGRGGVIGAGDVRWHMIGRLQRNKARLALPLVRLVHGVDSLRLAEELHALGARFDRVVEVLVQINATGQEGRGGVAPAAVLHLAEQIDSMVHLRLRGLMAMAPVVANPDDARPVFARAAELFEEVRSSRAGAKHVNLLSMGMSNDFEAAIAEGANVLRIGRALFGENDHAHFLEDDPPEGDGDDDDYSGYPNR